MTNSKSNSEENKKHLESVTFNNVDTALLEYQRTTLIRVEREGRAQATISGKDLAGLEGLINMLNVWSDDLYHKNNLTKQKK